MMNFEGVRLIYVDGEDKKYGVVVVIPQHLKVKKVAHKRPIGAHDPLGFNETIGIELEEVK